MLLVWHTSNQYVHTSTVYIMNSTFLTVFLAFVRIQSGFLYGWLGIVAFLLVIFVNFVGSRRAEQSMA